MVFSTMGAARIPGTIICSPAFRLLLGPVAICLTDRLRQFARSKVGCPLHVLPRQRPHAVPPFGFVQFRARWSEYRMHIRGLRRDGCRRSAAAYDFGRLLRDRMRHRYRRPVENDQDQCKKDPEGKGNITKYGAKFSPRSGSGADTTPRFLRSKVTSDQSQIGFRRWNERLYNAPECARIYISLASLRPADKSLIRRRSI